MVCLEEILETYKALDNTAIHFPLPRMDWVEETYDYLFDLRTKSEYMVDKPSDPCYSNSEPNRTEEKSPT